jgi:protein-disulfide isomerase
VAVGPTIKQLMSTYKGKIRLVVKNYPYKYRDYSYLAAEASLAALDQGKYWEMYEMLLKNSPALDRSSLIKYAQQLGLDVKKFTDSLDTMKHSAAVERDEKLAADLDLFNTPTFFINGQKVIGNRPYDYFKKIIEQELKHAKQ